MLKRVEIRNFRSCHDVVLDDLGPVTVLAGRNAVGKSNVLRAIQWAASTATAANVDQIQNASCKLLECLDASEFEYSIALLATSTDPARKPGAHRSESLMGADGEAILERKNEMVKLWPGRAKPQTINLGRYAPCLSALSALLPEDSDALPEIRQARAALRGIRYYPLIHQTENDNSRVVSQEEYETWLAQDQRTGDPEPIVLFRLLHMFLTMREQLDELRSLLGPDGLGIVDEIRIESWQPDSGPNAFYLIQFSPSLSSGQLFALEDLSDGTQRVIQILLALLFDRPSVMLLEHPEEKIHPGLLRKLISLLRTYSDLSQVIVSSHSPAVFNSLTPESIRLVTIEEGKTEVRAFSAEESGFVQKYLEEEGSLADFLETVEED